MDDPLDTAGRSASADEGASAGRVASAAGGVSETSASGADRNAGAVGSVPSLPRPGFWLAVGLAATPLAVQFGLGVILGVIIAVIGVASGMDARGLQELFEHSQGLLFGLGTLSTLLLAWLIAAVMYGRDAGRCIGWRSFSLPQGVAAAFFCLPLSVLASEATNGVVELLEWNQPESTASLWEQQSRMLADFSSLPFPLVLLAGCVFPGIGEEILCRGVIGRGLVARYGAVGGSMLASLLFGLMHLNPIQATGAFLIGLGLQYVFLTTRSLAAAMMVHAGNNALAFALLRYRDKLFIPGLSSLPEESISHTPSALLAASAALLTVATVLLFRLRTVWLAPDGTPWSPGYLSGEMPPAELNATLVQAPLPRNTFLLATVLLAVMVVVGVVR